MNKTFLTFLVVCTALFSLHANAQLKSVDHGAAVTDSSGLMWANTVGIDLSWSATGQDGSAQAWVAGLNASHYGGFDDWSLATGDGSVGANQTTNQLGQLFYSDCGNSVGEASVLNKPGKNCKKFSSLKSVIESPTIIFSSSPDPALSTPFENFFWAYQTPSSVQVPWTSDTAFGGGGGPPLIGLGDALAVRAAPEIDPSSAASALALLFGSLAVLRGWKLRRIRREM
jgi:hypothetical protein